MVTRKIDGAGRISLPKHIRDKYNIALGKEVELDSYEDPETGAVYIRIKTGLNVKDRDKEILAKYGLEMPNEENS